MSKLPHPESPKEQARILDGHARPTLDVIFSRYDTHDEKYSRSPSALMPLGVNWVASVNTQNPENANHSWSEKEGQKNTDAIARIEGLSSPR